MDDSVNPVVSVIITTYRNEDYLSRAIDSVVAQSYQNIQIIVVDDNNPESESRKATEKVMGNYPQVLYVKHHKNLNGAVARNTGIGVAIGKYIAFLDDDDIYFSNHIESCVNALETHEEYGCVLCGVVKIMDGMCWGVINPPTEDFVKNLFLTETTLGTGSNLFMRAEAVRTIKGFDENFLRHQDVEFGIRLFSKYDVYSFSDIQIVKGTDGTSNAPNFTRFLEVKQLLFKKFEQEINSMSECDKIKFYGGQYSALLYVACKTSNKEQMNWTISCIKKYRALNKKEKILVVFGKFHIFFVYEMIKKMIKKRKAKKLYEIVKQNLSIKDLKILNCMK